MSTPIYDDTTERLYAAMPDHYLQADPQQGYALKKLLRSIGAQLDQVETLVDRFTYDSPEDNVPNAHSTSDLINPLTADAKWLTWLAQIYGTRIKGRPERFRQEMAQGSNGFRGGTRAAMVAAAQTALIGNKFCVIYPHSTDAGPGTGGEWDMLVVTQDSETLTNLYPFQQATVSSPSDWDATYAEDTTNLATNGYAVGTGDVAAMGGGTVDGQLTGGPNADYPRWRRLSIATAVAARMGMSYNATRTDTGMATSPGQFVSASAMIRSSRALVGTIKINYINSSNTVLASKEASFNLAANTWTEVKVNNNVIAPAGTVAASVEMTGGSAAQWFQNGDTFGFTQLRVVASQIARSWPSSTVQTLDYYIKPYPDKDDDELWDQRALTWRIVESVTGDAYTWTLSNKYHVSVSPTDPAQVMLSAWAPTFEEGRSVSATLTLTFYNASDAILSSTNVIFSLTNDQQQINVGPVIAPATTSYYRTTLVVSGMHFDDQLSIAQLGARMESETPWISRTADPAQAIIDRGAKPAGIILYNVSFGSSWDEVEANLPTWNDWEAHTWTEIEEISLED